MDALSIAAGGDDLDLIELADEEQVLNEIAGRVLETYVYKFMGSDGKEVVGLSKVGVDWACREYAKRGEIIRVVDWDIVPDPVDPQNHILVVVESQRFKIDENNKDVALDNRLGTKRQPTKTKRRDGSVVTDANFVEKAFSKASRNSRMALLPHGFVKEMITMALKAGQVKILGGGRPAPPQQPPAAAQARRKSVV